MFMKGLEVNLLPEGRGLSTFGEAFLRESIASLIEKEGRLEEALEQCCRALAVTPADVSFLKG